ncbi:hypothetical protein Dimus_024842, partial [Dionaea muscipula]
NPEVISRSIMVCKMGTVSVVAEDGDARQFLNTRLGQIAEFYGRRVEACFFHT